MPKRIHKVELPSTVTSGKSFEVTVTYTSTEADTLEISYSGAFVGRPTSVSLPAGGSKPFKMTITRVKGLDQGSCRVTFVMGNQLVKQPKVT